MIRLIILFYCIFQSAAFELGKDYFTLEKEILTRPSVSQFVERLPGTVKVLQFYNFACGGCFYFEKFIIPWEKRLADNVSITKIPVLFHENWEAFVRAHYVLEALGKPEVAKEIFGLLHKKRQYISDPRRLANYLSNYGIKEEEFMQTYNSPSVIQASKIAEELMNEFNLTHIPTFAVIGPSGAFYTRPQSVATAPTFTNIIDEMIKESQ